MVGGRERNKRGRQIGLGIEHPVEYRLNSEASCPQSWLRSSRLPLFVKPQSQSAHTTADVGILAENMHIDATQESESKSSRHWSAGNEQYVIS